MENQLQAMIKELTDLYTEMNSLRPLSKKQVEQLEKNVRIEHV